MKKIEIIQNEKLKHYTTLHIGGVCKNIYFPKSEEEVKEVFNLQPIILGCGSNVLIDDTKVFENAMVLTKFNKIYVEEDEIIAEAGATLMDVCLLAYEHGLTGLEFAFGIPGSVGGAIMMNAGAYGGEMKDVLESVTVLTPNGEILVLKNEELELGYRTSIIAKKDYVVLSAIIKLNYGNKESIREKMNELKVQRTTQEDLNIGNQILQFELYFTKIAPASGT